jgi:hypothetical protein
MPITSETLALIRSMRIAVNAEADQAMRTLTARWVLAWDELAAEWQDAVSDVTEIIEDGRWPTRAQIDRLSRVRQALGTTLDALQRLSDDAVITITDAAGRAIVTADDWQGRLIDSQLPDGAHRIGIRWDRTDPEALRALVERTAGQIESLAYPLSGEAVDAMYRALLRGVAAGQNPRTIARLMLQRLQGEFNGGLARALNIARTEILDAYRDSSMIHNQANSTVLAGWIWSCDFSGRTCVSCLAQHGTLHPAGEPGPLDHQAGRCSRVPQTKSWHELGIDIPEPKGRDLPSARDWFAGLSQAKQIEIMGKGRWDLWSSGEIDWEDMTALRPNGQWRDSYGVRSLRDLVPTG